MWCLTNLRRGTSPVENIDYYCTDTTAYASCLNLPRMYACTTVRMYACVHVCSVLLCINAPEVLCIFLCFSYLISRLGRAFIYLSIYLSVYLTISISPKLRTSLREGSRRGLTRIHFCCSAKTKSNPDHQLCPRRCMRAGEPQWANGFCRLAAAHPYKAACVLSSQDGKSGWYTAMTERAAASRLLSTLQAYKRPCPVSRWRASGRLSRARCLGVAMQGVGNPSVRARSHAWKPTPNWVTSALHRSVHPLECAMLSVRLRTSTRARPCAAAHWACETRALALIGVLIGRSAQGVPVGADVSCQ